MGIRISELPEAVKIQPTDVIVISDTETRKISYSNLLAQLKEDISGQGGAVEVIRRTWRGLQIWITREGNFVSVTITGTVTQTIPAKEIWTTVETFPGIIPDKDIICYAIVSATNTLRFKWDTTGTMYLGWGRVTATQVPADILPGYILDMQVTFNLK